MKRSRDREAASMVGEVPLSDLIDWPQAGAVPTMAAELAHYIRTVYGRGGDRAAWARRAASDLMAGRPFADIEQLPGADLFTHDSRLLALARVVANVSATTTDAPATGEQR